MSDFLKKLIPAKLKNSADTIPVVRMSGTIASGGTAFRPALSLAVVAEPLERAFDIKKAPAVAIVINSPGGSPVQSRLIYRRIKDLAAEKKKKVHVFVEDVAASGGYMIACAGDDITADPSSIVGSIGVVTSGFGFVKTIEKLGVERRLHTAGKNKAVLDPFLPEKADDIKRLKQLQLEIHQTFIDLVTESRGSRLAEDEGLFTGQFWTGDAGLKLGLVDSLGDIRSSLKRRYGDKTKLKLIEAKKGIFGRKSSIGIALPGAIDPAMIASAAADGVIGAAEERALWARFGL